MKKRMFPLVAVLFFCVVAVAQETQKHTSNDAVAMATKTVTHKPAENAVNTVAPLKTTTVAGKAAPIRRKRHRHHHHKVIAKRM